jgi:tetratricopeptide (TPR) repeat protein
MLFERIRRTQKPVFIFLAIMFALGFAFLGVGSGTGGFNPLDVFTGSGSSGPSIGSLQSQLQKSPNDASTWLKLAQAYQTDGQQNAAIAAYQRYVTLRPNDQLQAGTLAGLLEQRAGNLAQRAQLADQQATGVAGQGGGLAVQQLKLSQGLSGPLATSLAQPLQSQASSLASRAQADYTQAIALRKQLLKSDPTNNTYEFLLATDALNARDYSTAISAFQRYLKLVPNDPRKKQILALIKQLRPFAGTSSTTPGG